MSGLAALGGLLARACATALLWVPCSAAGVGERPLRPGDLPEGSAFHQQVTSDQLTLGYGGETAHPAASGYDPGLDRRAGAGYIDTRWALPGAVDLELGLFSGVWEAPLHSRRRIDPRLAVAWQPLPGQLLRGALRTDMQLPLRGSSLPADTLGLVPVQPRLTEGALARTAQLQWDADWSDSLGTAVSLQRSSFDHYVAELPDGRLHPAAVRGAFTRLGLTASLALDEATRLVGRWARERSRDESPGAAGALALRPERESGVELRWEPSPRLGGTLGATWVGSRVGASGALPPYATTHLQLRWQAAPGAELELAAANLLGARFEAADGVPGPGRELVFGGRLRF